ncbi:MAG: IS4 family transposase [Acidobacteriota bacterium]
MAHNSTVLSQLLKLIPRHEFESAARRHHRGRRLRSIRRWDQLVALATAQLTRRASLRDLVSNLRAQSHKLYHVGARPVSRSSLARVNRDQPASLYQEIYEKLLARTSPHAPRHQFKFQGKLFSLDATFLKLTASMFPWAKFNTAKGAAKLHIGLDHDGYLPRFVELTDGQSYDGDWARTLDLPAGSVVVFDRGYVDFKLFKRLISREIRFVTRHRRDLRYTVLERRPVEPDTGLTSDQLIRMQGKSGLVLRRIGYRDPESGKHYVFLTNAEDLPALTITQIYKERWKIEIFFKWIKQNLRVLNFLGTSPNAVLSQIWVALIVYLLLQQLKLRAKVEGSLQKILRLLQLNLFDRRNLLQLLRPPPKQPPEEQLQLPINAL